MARLNYREIVRKVASSEVGRRRITTIARQRFDEAKQQMLEDFDEDPVTQELQAASSNPLSVHNISNTLPGSVQGNLYSFIGFEEDPTEAVRQALEDSTQFISTARIQPNGNKINCKFSLRIDKEAINKAAPLPFESGKSWTEGIEKGISGFSRFLAGYFNTSRSGGGIQGGEEVRQEEFRPRPYISKIINDFTARLRNR